MHRHESPCIVQRQVPVDFILERLEERGHQLAGLLCIGFLEVSDEFYEQLPARLALVLPGGDLGGEHVQQLLRPRQVKLLQGKAGNVLSFPQCRNYILVHSIK